MAENSIKGLMDTTIEKIKEMVDGNTVMGDPITTPDGTVIIPVSKINLGFGTGGSDFPTKNPQRDGFGGGCGAGIAVTPQAFLVVSNGNVRLLQLAGVNNTADRIINMVPDVIDKVSSFIPNKNDKEKKGE